jgi:hypothetical protein
MSDERQVETYRVRVLVQRDSDGAVWAQGIDSQTGAACVSWFAERSNAMTLPPALRFSPLKTTRKSIRNLLRVPWREGVSEG